MLVAKGAPALARAEPPIFQMPANLCDLQFSRVLVTAPGLDGLGGGLSRHVQSRRPATWDFLGARGQIPGASAGDKGSDRRRG